jgi:dolichyl-phosphate-mannose-protein mannosyltransferase
MPTDRLAGWLWPVGIAVLAGVLRFRNLGVPGSHVFDEVYYAKEGWQFLQFGVEYDAGKDAASFVVHPPAGKWAIAVGQWMFGNDAFGWRFSAAVVGTLSVLMLARIARRMTRSTALGCAAGLLLTFDGLHLVSSRTALLDVFLMVFVLGAFGCLLLDRDASRKRLAVLMSRRGSVSSPGPGLGLRPWRLAAGVFLGLAVATKWSALWFVAVFGLMTLLWDAAARRAAGQTRPRVTTLVRDAAPAFVSLVVVGLGVYLVSWTGWFVSGERGYDRFWASGRDTGWPFVPEALRSLWHYHSLMWNFHVDLDESHSYESHPWGWLVLARPVSYFYTGPKAGESGCEVSACAREVLALGTPAVWWAAVLALVVMVWGWLGRRDWRCGAVLAGVAAGYLPWFAFTDRPIFSFYSIVFLPFLVLGIVIVLGMILGPPEASERRRTWAAAGIGVYLLLVIANFHYFHPLWTAEVFPYEEWRTRMWLKSWI